MPREARRALRKVEGSDEASDDEDDAEVERITREEAMWMPILGSVMLLGLFAAVKFLDPATLALLLNVYFGLVGVAGLTHLGSLIMRAVVPRARWRAFTRWTYALYYGEDELFHLRFTNLHIVAFALSLSVCALYFVTRRWWLSNVLAAALAFNGICVVKLDSMMTGIVLLAGLFFCARAHFLDPLTLRRRRLVRVPLARRRDGYGGQGHRWCAARLLTR